MLSSSIPSLDDQDAAITIALAATTGVYALLYYNKYGFLILPYRVTAALFQVPNQPVIFTVS